jgi:nucleotide-binding universal stress UspA family protein
MEALHKILVTTDFSKTARKAFPAAAGLARRYGASLLLAYVEESRLPPVAFEYADVGLDQLIERQRTEAASQLDRIARADFEGLSVTLRTAEGIPHLEIVGLAEREKVDLIVMATHGRGFFSHAILGSTTERVVRRAPCPVLVVRDAEGV